MKLNPEDPRLSAYLLGELSAEDAAAVERAVAADPALGLALQELENVQRLLTNTLSPGSSSLLPRQRETVLRSARHADQSGQAPTVLSRRPPLLIPLAAAAVMTLAVFLLIRLPSDTLDTVSKPPATNDDHTLPLKIALLPAPGPPDASRRNTSETRPTASSDLTRASEARASAMEKEGDLFLRKVAERLSSVPLPAANDLPPLHRRGSVDAAQNPTLQLPVHAGRASLGWITRSILVDRQRPPANAVRTEEILNHFALRPAGAASISQGVTLSTETISCPWKPSATLLLVSFRGTSDSAREVTASFHANAARVRSYRLLGFAPVSGLKPGPLPTRLPPKTITSLVIEIEPATSTGDLGVIKWSVSGRKAPPVNITRHGAAEPSDDARFAALVCTYTQWLVRESSGMIDTDLLAALARESAAETLPAERVDFLNLIDRSLGL